MSDIVEIAKLTIMNKEQILDDIINILESLGMTVGERERLYLPDYITSSIEFVAFIVAAEEKFGIIFPDQWLQYETIENIELLCGVIEEEIKKICNI